VTKGRGRCNFLVRHFEGRELMNSGTLNAIRVRVISIPRILRVRMKSGEMRKRNNNDNGVARSIVASEVCCCYSGSLMYSGWRSSRSK